MITQDRIRILGWAQLGNKNYQHIGMEWWTDYLAAGEDNEKLTKEVELNRQILVQYLSTYADKDK